MDSKGIAVILAIVTTVGSMGIVAIYGGNSIAGSMSSTNIIPKDMQVIYVGGNNPSQASIELTNQGSTTLKNVTGIILFGDKSAKLTPLASTITSYGSIGFTGPLHNYTSDQTLEVYPGDTVLLEVSADITTGDAIQKIFKIIVK